jgi:membrane protein required for colicin V production
VNWLDFALVVIFALSVLGGLLHGFARVGIGFIATLVALMCGLWFYGTPASFLLPYMSHKGFANFLGFAVVFVSVVLAGALVSKLLALLFRWAGLTWLDRLLGAGFGVLRGLIFAVALVLALLAFSPEPPPPSVVNSRFAPYIVDAAQICASFAPYEVREGVRESYEKAKEIWEDLLDEGVRKLRERQV